MIERKYKDGENVGGLVVESAQITLFGWKYRLRYPKADGTADRRLRPWYFFEPELITTIQHTNATKQ